MCVVRSPSSRGIDSIYRRWCQHFLPASPTTPPTPRCHIQECLTMMPPPSLFLFFLSIWMKNEQSTVCVVDPPPPPLHSTSSPSPIDPHPQPPMLFLPHCLFVFVWFIYYWTWINSKKESSPPHLSHRPTFSCWCLVKLDQKGPHVSVDPHLSVIGTHVASLALVHSYSICPHLAHILFLAYTVCFVWFIFSPLTFISGLYWFRMF